jgi:hypothetical protein
MLNTPIASAPIASAPTAKAPTATAPMAAAPKAAWRLSLNHLHSLVAYARHRTIRHAKPRNSRSINTPAQ